MSAGLRIERDGAVARLILDRPPLENVLSREMNRALAIAADELAASAEVAVVVLSGGTSRGFSAGVEVADHVPETLPEMLADFHSAIRAIGRLIVSRSPRFTASRSEADSNSRSVAIWSSARTTRNSVCPRSSWAAIPPSPLRCCRSASAGAPLASWC